MQQLNQPFGSIAILLVALILGACQTLPPPLAVSPTDSNQDATTNTDPERGVNRRLQEGTLLLSSSSGDGVVVQSASFDGVVVQSANLDGVVVESADGDGVVVESAGSDGVVVESAGLGGVVVESSEFDGMRVNSAGFDGVVVNSADVDGVVVNSAGFDGVFVGSAGADGVIVESAGDFAGFFDGNVAITGTCTGCTLAALGYNAGQTALEPGDVVAVSGVFQTDLPNASLVMDVELANGPNAVIGVVAGRAELDDRQPDKGEKRGKTILRLVPREGPAGPGEYVSIVIYGLAQVKASAVDSPIQHGTRLTAADQPGYARAVRTVEVQGVQVAENTPVIGVALESLKDGQALIWALVNPR